MKYLSLFSGIGGFELGFPKDWECVGYSEIYPEAIKVYEQHYPEHKNYGDITRIQPATLPNFDLLCGGFPCQSFSIAGSRKGFDDTRGTLFFDIARIVKEKRPRYLLLENVGGLLSHDQGRTYKVILSTLTELGYDTEGLVFDSYDFGQGRRKRVYLLATHGDYTASLRQGVEQAISLYLSRWEGIRDTDSSARKQEISRGSARIIRTFARLPDWLDSWDTIYSQEENAWQRCFAPSSPENRPKANMIKSKKGRRLNQREE